MSEQVSLFLFQEPGGKNSLLKGLQKLNCGAFDHLFGGEGWDVAFTARRASQPSRVVDDEYSRYFSSAHPSPNGIEIALNQPKSMDFLVEEMKKNRLEDENKIEHKERIRKIQPDKNNKMSLSSMDHLAKGRKNKKERREHSELNARDNSNHLDQFLSNPGVSHSKEDHTLDAKQMVFPSHLNDLAKKELYAYIIPKEEDQLIMDTISVITGETEPETLDGSWLDEIFSKGASENPPIKLDNGSWPDDPFTRELHGLNHRESQPVQSTTEPNLPKIRISLPSIRGGTCRESVSCENSMNSAEMLPIQWNEQGLATPERSNLIHLRRVTTLERQEESKDGSWPDDPVSRELSGLSQRESPPAQSSDVASMSPSQRESTCDSSPWGLSTAIASLVPETWQGQCYDQRTMKPTQSNCCKFQHVAPVPESDELCNATSCRMSTGICVDCTKCTKHCDCETEPVSQEVALYDPLPSTTSEELICAVCSKFAKHCECHYLVPQGGPSSGPDAHHQWTEGRLSTQLAPADLIRTSSFPYPRSVASQPSSPVAAHNVRRQRHSYPPTLGCAMPRSSVRSPGPHALRRSRSMTSQQMVANLHTSPRRPHAGMMKTRARPSRRLGGKREVLYRNFQQ